MEKNLFTFLKYEQQLLEELVRLSVQQQKALIKFDATLLEEIAAYQDEVAKSLKQAEEQRINMLMSWLSLNRRQASSLTLSALSKNFKGTELEDIKDLRKQMKILVDKLHSTNSLNRVLANRASNNIKEMIVHFTNGTNQLCNVKI